MIAWQDDLVTLLHGDCLELLLTIEDNSIDAVVTDPPYGLGFMGHQWDQPGHAIDGPREGIPSGQRRRTTPNPSAFSAQGAGAKDAGRYDLSRTANQGFQAWCEAWAVECHRVLKPGGHILSFGGSRTWHRLAAAIEDAGFEIRDSIAWLYGSGFPKSLDVAKAIDKTLGVDVGADERWVATPHPVTGAMKTSTGQSEQIGQATPGLRHLYDADTDQAKAWKGWGTALKPSFEPIVVGRKALIGTVAANVLAYGTGGINVDGTRVAVASGDEPAAGSRTATFGTEETVPGGDGSGGWSYPGTGRWPPNVLLGHSDDCSRVGTRQVRTGTAVQRNLPDEGGSTGTVAFKPGTQRGPDVSYGVDGVETVEAWACAPGCPVAELDAQSGSFPGRTGMTQHTSATEVFAMKGSDRSKVLDGTPDYGGASRFFPVFRYEAKAATSERPRIEGGEPNPSAIGRKRCAVCGKQAVNVQPSSTCQCDEPQWEDAASSSATAHPTVKPLDLMRWLVRLVTPPGGIVLDPFAGSGTTGEACVIEGFRAVLIEREDNYLPLIIQRLSKPIQPDLFGGLEPPPPRDPSEPSSSSRYRDQGAVPFAMTPGPRYDRARQAVVEDHGPGLFE